MGKMVKIQNKLDNNNKRLHKCISVHNTSHEAHSFSVYLTGIIMPRKLRNGRSKNPPNTFASV